MKKWLAVLASLAVLVGATAYVLDRRAEEQRKNDRAAAYAVAVRFLTDWTGEELRRHGSRDPDRLQGR